MFSKNYLKIFETLLIIAAIVIVAKKAMNVAVLTLFLLGIYFVARKFVFVEEYTPQEQEEVETRRRKSKLCSQESINNSFLDYIFSSLKSFRG